eukprot:Em0006g937a
MQASYTVERQGVVVFEGLKDNKMDTYEHMKQAILKRLHLDTGEGRIYAAIKQTLNPNKESTDKLARNLECLLDRVTPGLPHEARDNIDDELFLAVFCDVDGMDERVHIRMKFLAVEQPNYATASGLFQYLKCCLHKIGVKTIDAEECKGLVGIGTDGYQHQYCLCWIKGVELAIKDALKSITFDLIDEMLLRMYYIYEKSSKKCRELENIITDLKQFMKFDDAGVHPVWVTHKLSVMKLIISKFGAYTSHLAALSEESSTKAADRAKLKGYLKKWLDAKYLLGCAFLMLDGWDDLIHYDVKYSHVIINVFISVLKINSQA